MPVDAVVNLATRFLNSRCLLGGSTKQPKKKTLPQPSPTAQPPERVRNQDDTLYTHHSTPMRNKRTGYLSGTVPSNNSATPENYRPTGATADVDAPSPDVQQLSGTGAFSSSSLNSFSNKRAADMLAGCNSSTSLELGALSSSENGAAAPGAPPKNNTIGGSLLSEIREGAERLATELDEYLSRGAADRSFSLDRGALAPLSDEGVADLQLATARKLREVRGQRRFSFADFLAGTYTKRPFFNPNRLVLAVLFVDP